MPGKPIISKLIPKIKILFPVLPPKKPEQKT